MALELYPKPTSPPGRNAPRPRSAPASAPASWQRKRWRALAIRSLGFAVPLVACGVAATAANALLPVSTHRPLIVVRTLVVIAASMAAVFVVDKGVRRCLPLATLFQLSLVFPDEAPSRFRLALKAGSSRNIARLAAHARLHGLDDDPQAAAEQVLVLIGALGEHDRRTRGHSERVRLFADLIGEEMHLTEEERQKLQWGALLHDLGKLETPVEILNKKGPLTDAEWAIMCRHPEAGRRLLRPLIPFLGEWAEAVWKHHERWDGTGYPREIPALRIGRSAAIVAVADSFEVMTSARSYKKAMSVAEARAELTRCAGKHFSPDVVRAFLSVSLGRVRLAMGPVAALSHIPFLQRMIEVPAAMSTTMTNTVGLAMSAAAPTVAAGVVGVSAMFITGVIETPAADTASVAAAARSSLDAAPSGADDGPATSQPPDGRTDGATTTTTGGNRTTAPTAPPASGGPITTTTLQGATTTTITTTSSTTTLQGATTTTTRAVSTTTLPRPNTPATTTTTTTATTTTAAPPAAAPTTTTAARASTIYVSLHANRSSPSLLHSKSFAAGTPLYIFVRSTRDIQGVTFFKYANLTGDGSLFHQENDAEYDLEGTASDGTALPWSPTAGTKGVTAVVTYTDGSTEIVGAWFSVS